MARVILAIVVQKWLKFYICIFADEDKINETSHHCFFILPFNLKILSIKYILAMLIPAIPAEN